MIMSEKKKPSSLIVAKLSAGKEAPLEATEGPEVDDSMARESAAEELISAIHSKDAKAVASAMSAMLELCGHEADEAGTEEAAAEGE
jgi:hypothetical protein